MTFMRLPRCIASVLLVLTVPQKRRRAAHSRAYSIVQVPGRRRLRSRSYHRGVVAACQDRTPLRPLRSCLFGLLLLFVRLLALVCHGTSPHSPYAISPAQVADVLGSAPGIIRGAGAARPDIAPSLGALSTSLRG